MRRNKHAIPLTFEEHTTKLQRVLKFSAGDLEANCSGYLSDAQKKALHRYQVSTLIGLPIASILILGFILGTAWIFRPSEREEFVADLVHPQMLLLLAGLAVVIVFAAILDSQKFRRDYLAGDVRHLCGPIRFVSESKRFGMTVDDQFLAISAFRRRAFEQNVFYCVYYVANSRKILSAQVFAQPAATGDLHVTFERRYSTNNTNRSINRVTKYLKERGYRQRGDQRLIFERGEPASGVLRAPACWPAELTVEILPDTGSSWISLRNEVVPDYLPPLRFEDRIVFEGEMLRAESVLYQRRRRTAVSVFLGCLSFAGLAFAGVGVIGFSLAALFFAADALHIDTSYVKIVWGPLAIATLYLFARLLQRAAKHFWGIGETS